VVVGSVAISGLGSMAAKQIKDEYHEDATFLETQPLKHYRDTFPDDENWSKQVKVVCLRPVPSTRWYECKVVGLRPLVELSLPLVGQ
jgi:hypothetical protein